MGSMNAFQRQIYFHFTIWIIDLYIFLNLNTYQIPLSLDQTYAADPSHQKNHFEFV